MLALGPYLLGAAVTLTLAAFAWLGGASLRAKLLPSFRGAPAHLATAVLSLALLIWPAELLGSFGLLEPAPYALLVAAIGVSLRALLGRVAWGGGSRPPPAPHRVPPPRQGPPARALTAIALLIAAIATLKFAVELKPRLSTGMTGFDSTWYHAPFAAGFLQSGDTWGLHFIAPQFLAWFYPANGEVFHAAGMLAFDRDLLSPLLNLGWFAGCLLACWCIGRPYGVAPWSLILGAAALSVPALADQAGEARNDVVGIFFLLAAAAVVLNARGLPATGPLLGAGLAAGLAAGTKLNFLLPAAVLVAGLAVLAPRGGRARAFGVASLAALAGGGYWYLRNLAHSGNPLPWIEAIGPISLPAPDQALGGREAHSVAGYLFDGAVWSNWFLPGLHDGLWFLWPLLLAAALAGLLLCLTPPTRGSVRTVEVGKEPRADRGGWKGGDSALALVALAGLATALAWLIAPTSASGPDGSPRGFESGLRYLAPALVLGLALLPAAPLVRQRLSRLTRTQFLSDSEQNCVRVEGEGLGWRRWPGAVAVGGVASLVLLLVAAGYPVQRHYLEKRYSDPSFSAPGLNAAFAWARDVSDARIATTSTRQYPLYGTDLSNHVQFIGERRPHGGFEAPSTCRGWREALNAGDYDYVVTSKDRLEPGKPPYPPEAGWTAGPSSRIELKEPPTVVYELNGTLDPSACG